MRAWLAAFDTFAAMNPKTIVPSHGPVGDGSLIASSREIMQTIRTRVRALKAQGRSSEDAAATVQTEMQAKYPGYPRANGIAAAARSSYAED
jgi:hypothetical protein